MVKVLENWWSKIPVWNQKQLSLLGAERTWMSSVVCVALANKSSHLYGNYQNQIKFNYVSFYICAMLSVIENGPGRRSSSGHDCEHFSSRLLLWTVHREANSSSSLYWKKQKKWTSLVFCFTAEITMTNPMLLADKEGSLGKKLKKQKKKEVFFTFALLQCVHTFKDLIEWTFCELMAEILSRNISPYWWNMLTE